MGTSEDNVVLVTALGGGDEVVGPPLLGDGINLDGTLEGARRGSSENNAAVLAGEGESGDIGALGAGWSTESASNSAVNVVVDDGGGGAGTTSESGLETELALAAGNECNFALDGFGVVGLERTLVYG